MDCMTLLRRKLTALGFDRQSAEFQIRVAILQRFTARGIPATQAAD